MLDPEALAGINSKNATVDWIASSLILRTWKCILKCFRQWIPSSFSLWRLIWKNLNGLQNIYIIFTTLDINSSGSWIKGIQRFSIIWHWYQMLEWMDPKMIVSMGWDAKSLYATMDPKLLGMDPKILQNMDINPNMMSGLNPTVLTIWAWSKRCGTTLTWWQCMIWECQEWCHRWLPVLLWQMALEVLAPTTNFKRSISARRIESEEEHSVEKNIPVYNFNKFHTMLTRGFYQWWW